MLGQDEVVIREYREGDEAQINLLYNEHYGLSRGTKEWQWEFREGPYGKSIFVVAERNGEVIGTRAQLPTLLSYGGQEILTGKNEHSLVKQELRGQRIFERLCDECVALAARRDMAFLWGFSYAEKAYRRAGYKVLGRLKHLILILKPFQAYQMFRDRIPTEVKARFSSQMGQKLLLRTFTWAGYLWFRIKRQKTRPSSGFNVVLLDQADNRLDAFWEAFSRQKKFYTIARSSRYLDWRIFRNPNIISQLLAVLKDDRIQGYVILTRGVGESIGHITDFCVLDEHFKEVARLLMVRAVEYFVRQGVVFVDAWRIGNNPETKKYSACLRRFGFVPLPMVGSPFELKILTDEGALPGNPDNLDQWYITMLLSEGLG